MSKLLPPIKAKPATEFYLFGSTNRFRTPLPPSVNVCRAADLDQVVRLATSNTVFISFHRTSTIALLKSSMSNRPRARGAQLLTIEPPPAESVPALLGVFGTVLGLGKDSRWLPVEELVRVITGNDASSRFIGGAADMETETLALVRGSRETMVLPFSAFETSGDGTEPDFSKLGFTDFGHTVALGDYEASADAILYENDATYRQNLKKERLKSEQSFGASLRRLRLQRKLTQEDFAPLAKKTIARIERNEVGKPHGKTLNVLAQRLGVSADQIESY
ncbi:helix-turn-helix domain-containing protein [Singulisphaera sp. Ch08]|uniref:Helix-turn-helix domain-containing protein n=1 Tax=Singulisphaera sp. Ch08 TaxID=3120278 RepID=A0AAU7C932_9BACT